MKKNYLLIIFLIASLFGNATIITVNNESGSSADYSDLNAAIGAAVAGDTLYIQPASASYGNISLSKSITLMGAGHNPSFSPYQSSIGSINFQNGSSGCVIKGMTIQVIVSAGSAVVNNVFFSGCRMFNTSATPISLSSGTYNNWIFEGCVIESANTGGINLGGLGSNAIFRNNFLYSVGEASVIYNAPSGSLFDHNILFHHYNTSFFGSIAGANATSTNNIVITEATSNYGENYSCSGCSYNNNMLYAINGSGSFPALAGANNLVNSNPNFLSFAITYAYSYLYDLHLSDTSAGNNAASDGTDIGIYGGIATFSPIGTDSGSPHINTFTLGSSTAPQGGTITIHLNASGSGQ